MIFSGRARKNDVQLNLVKGIPVALPGREGPFGRVVLYAKSVLCNRVLMQKQETGGACLAEAAS